MPVILGPLKLIKESGSLLDRIAKKVKKNPKGGVCLKKYENCFICVTQNCKLRHIKDVAWRFYYLNLPNFSFLTQKSTFHLIFHK